MYVYRIIYITKKGRDGVMVARGLVVFSYWRIIMRSAFNLGSIPSPGSDLKVRG